jgi:hypothetical protein
MPNFAKTYETQIRRNFHYYNIMQSLKASRPSLASSQRRAPKKKRQVVQDTACSKRPPGLFGQRYLKIEMLPSLDPQCLRVQRLRRFGASVALETPRTRLEESARVMSAPRRPGCASTMNENQLRSRRARHSGNVVRPERCMQCLEPPKTESERTAREKKPPYRVAAKKEIKHAKFI